MERAEKLAAFFHETYERLAPEHGYETRKDSAVPWALVPEQNRNLMIAVCQEILDREDAAEEDETVVQQIHAERRLQMGEKGITIEDFQSWIFQKAGQGWPAGLLLKMAVISINALFTAAERWQRLEGGFTASAPIWLDTTERDALLKALRGEKGTTIRVVRQAFQAMLP